MFNTLFHKTNRVVDSMLSDSVQESALAEMPSQSGTGNVLPPCLPLFAYKGEKLISPLPACPTHDCRHATAALLLVSSSQHS